MTVNELIINTMQMFDLPVTPDFFGDGNTEYITFNFPDERGVLFGDNEPLAVASQVQIHYFLPADKDYLATKKAMRRALHNAGFTYPEVTILMEPGNKTRHIIFECEIENEYEMEE